MIGSGPATLVGRVQELAVLRAALDDAAGGRPSAVLLAGPAGIGKSRLVGALREAVPPSALVLATQCVDLGDPGLAFLTVTDLLRGVRERAAADPVVAAALARAPVLTTLGAAGAGPGAVPGAPGRRPAAGACPSAARVAPAGPHPAPPAPGARRCSAAR